MIIICDVCIYEIHNLIRMYFNSIQSIQGEIASLFVDDYENKSYNVIRTQPDCSSLQNEVH